MTTQTDTAATADAAMQMPESPSLDDVIAAAPLPEPAVAPAGDPITPEAVQSDKAPEDSLPDSSLIADRLQKQEEQSGEAALRREAEQKYSDDQEELRQLRLLRRGEADPAPTTGAEVVASDEREDRIKSLEARLDLADQQARRQAEFTQRQQEQSDVVEYVTENKVHFPMLNALGHQALPYQKMRNHKEQTGTWMSEAQAGREVEAEVVDIVHLCAPLLGYTKGDAAPRREEEVSVGTPNLTIAGSPVELGDLPEDDAIKAIVSEYEQNQR